MRLTGTIPASWWQQVDTELIRRESDTIALACFLLTCPMANAYGLYAAPREFMAVQMPGIENVERALALLEDYAFCSYDKAAGVVWVHQAARWHFVEPLRASDNNARAARKWYAGAPVCDHLAPFYAAYAAFLSLPPEPKRGRAHHPVLVASRADGTKVYIEERTWTGLMFRQVHAAYPEARRGDPHECWILFEKLVAKEQPEYGWVRRTLVHAIEQSKQSAQWHRWPEKRVPLLRTWLYERRWTQPTPPLVLGRMGRPVQPLQLWKINAADFRLRLQAGRASLEAYRAELAAKVAEDAEDA